MQVKKDAIAATIASYLNNSNNENVLTLMEFLICEVGKALNKYRLPVT